MQIQLQHQIKISFSYTFQKSVPIERCKRAFQKSVVKKRFKRAFSDTVVSSTFPRALDHDNTSCLLDFSSTVLHNKTVPRSQSSLAYDFTTGLTSEKLHKCMKYISVAAAA